MADFSYSFGKMGLSTAKFEKLYTARREVAPGFTVFYNDKTVTHIAMGEGSITILGYARDLHRDTADYLETLLKEFAPEHIPDIKRRLIGQYTAIVQKGGKVWLFSDFLQVYNIFYASEDGLVCSSFEALHAATGEGQDPYKQFEYIALRHCHYPAWLGSATLNPRVRRLRAFEYLEICTATGAVGVHEFNIPIDNRKEQSLHLIKEATLNVLRRVVCDPVMTARQDANVQSTITGGFDSRLMTGLVKGCYPGVSLRISSFWGAESPDLKIARKVAASMRLPLEVYSTDREAQKEWFYGITDHITPKENSIIATLLQNTAACGLGFGGAFGTELYSSFDYDGPGAMTADFVARARRHVMADEEYFARFEKAVRDEFSDIDARYTLEISDQRDLVRLFKLVNTAYFSSTLVRAFSIYGRQLEPFGTFAVVEMGLKIPYEYLGDKNTLGRFYLIPKSLMEKIDRKASRILTTNFYPMRPLSVCSLPSYLLGKQRRKKYYAQMARQEALDPPKTLHYEGQGWKYETSNPWIEGFALRYLQK